jgi:hypothetical protein
LVTYRPTSTDTRPHHPERRMETDQLRRHSAALADTRRKRLG